MSNTPPDRPQTISAAAASGAAATGDETIEVTPTEARGAMRTGRAIWILVISLAAVTVVLIGLWLVQAPRMATVTHPQARDMNARDVSTFNTPAGSARGAPPDVRATNTQ